MPTSNRPSFIRAALERVRDRAFRPASYYPNLHHMLVLPIGQTISLLDGDQHGKHNDTSCLDAVFGTTPTRRYDFADDEVWTEIPNCDMWPDSPPLRAVSAEPNLPGANTPFRVHLFFGSALHFNELRTLATNILELSDDFDRAIFGDELTYKTRLGFSTNTVFHKAGDIRRDGDANFIDEWMCTLAPRRAAACFAEGGASIGD